MASEVASPGKSNRASFAQVIFNNVEESYHDGADVNCAYTVAALLEVNSRDWVGLFKVGWRSQSDYVYYDWSPMPPDYTKGQEFKSNIVFPAHKLPKDDGEFYQFCYVSSAGHICGASTPFQFRQPSNDDLIEIEDENGELLVIKTKTAVMEEHLRKANETRAQLKHEIHLLQNELDLLRRNEDELQIRLHQQRKDNDVKQRGLEEALEKLDEQKQQISHLQDRVAALQDKIEIINQEKVTMERRLDDSDAYISSLQEKIKTLVNEKDSLIGRARGLEEEKELYLTYFHESDKLKKRLSEEEAWSARMRKEVERMEKEIYEQEVVLNAQMMASMMDKETIDDLSERLRNAEDKLQAAELCKTMLNDEVLALKQEFEKTSLCFLKSSEEFESVMKSFDETTEKTNLELEEVKAEKNLLKLELDVKIEEAKTLTSEVNEMKDQMNVLSGRQKMEADGSLYALQTAHQTLKERYAKLQNKNESMQKSLEQTQTHLLEMDETREDDKCEIRSLRERLLMGEEAYKEKYIECEQLESELSMCKRALTRNGHHAWRKNSREKSSNSSPVTDDVIQKNSDSDTTADRKTMQNQSVQTLFNIDEISESLTSKELQEQLRDIGAELEKRRNKGDKYKRMYVDERRRNEDSMEKLEHSNSEVLRLKELLKLTMAKEGTQLGSSISSLLNAMDSDDVINGKLHIPLKPLPPPMEPKKLSSPICPCLNDISNMADESFDQLATDGTNGEEERFVDAPGEPQHFYPACSNLEDDRGRDEEEPEREPPGRPAPPSGMRVCPMCSQFFPANYTDRQYVDHVNSHFDDA